MLNRIFISLFRSLPLVTKDSDAQKPFSNHHSWVWKQLVSMKPLTTPSWSVMSISERIFMPILSSLVVPLCIQVLLTVCKRKSQLLLHQQWKSKSLPHQKENIPSGLVVLFWLHSQPSNRCGSQNKNTMNLVHLSSTENASKLQLRNSFILVLCNFHFSSNQTWILKSFYGFYI